MKPISHHLNSALVFVSRAAIALRRLPHRCRRSAIGSGRAIAPAKVGAPAPRLGPGREWELVAGLIARELARAGEIAAIQARAALKIDAAEHTLNRIAADCAKVMSAPVARSLRPARRLTRHAEPRTRERLAA